MPEFIVKAIVTREVEMVVEADSEEDVRTNIYELIDENEIATLDIQIEDIRPNE